MTTPKAAWGKGLSLYQVCADDSMFHGANYVEYLVAGTNVTIDTTDSSHPIVNATGGGGSTLVHAGNGISVNNTDPSNPVVTNTGVYSVVAGDNITVDNTDPHNPVVAASGGGGNLLTTVTDLKPSDIVLMYLTPVEIVPAPASGKYMVPVSQVYQTSRAIVVPSAGTFEGYIGANSGVWAQWWVSGSPSPSILHNGAPRADMAALQPNYVGQMNPAPSYLPVSTMDAAPMMLTSGSLWALNDGGDGVVRITVGPPNNPGNIGFAVGDTGIVAAGNSDCHYIVTSVDMTGAITGISVTAPGTGYSTNLSDLTLTPGAPQPGVGTCDTAHVVVFADDSPILRITTTYYTPDIL